MIHIFESSARALGMGVWNPIMSAMHTPVFKIGEILVFVGFAFHALNGIRLILIELGLIVGKPKQPLYPYTTSLNVQRPWMIVVMVIAVVLIVMGGVDIFFLA
jgi:succinate dehydrogenase / fumarate reductase cytochrome b subunit